MTSEQDTFNLRIEAEIGALTGVSIEQLIQNIVSSVGVLNNNALEQGVISDGEVVDLEKMVNLIVSELGSFTSEEGKEKISAYLQSVMDRQNEASS